MRNPKLLVKLIDRAILPAVSLVAAKVIGLVIVAVYLNINLFDNITALSALSPSQFIALNTYSTLFMVGIVLLGIAWVLFKAHVTHDSHISPSFSARLASLRLHGMVKGSMDVFSEAAIWLAYLWLLTFAVTVQGLLGSVYMWLPMLTFSVAVIASILTIWDIEREFEKPVEEPDDNQIFSTYLKFSEFDNDSI